MKIKAILFDLDGVLINSPEAIWKTHNLTAKKLGYPTCKKEDIYRLIGIKWEILITTLIPNVDTKKFIETNKKLMDKVYKNVKLIGNADKVLKKLKERGFRLALVSGSHREYAIHQLTRLGFDIKLLDLMVNAEDTVKHKPDPDPILFALEKLKVRPEETIYIGDSLLDYRAAKSAGVHFIGTLSGVSKLEDFLKNNVIYVVEDIGELLNHFKNGELMFVRKSVAAFVKFDKKILLLKRSDNVATYPGMWAIVHGRIDNGENPEIRARKEVKEETGLEIKLIKRGKVITVNDRKMGIAWHFYPFLFEAKSPKVKLNWEHTDYLWVDKKDIKKYNKDFVEYEKFLSNCFEES